MIRFFLYFALSFTLLSIPIKQKQLFYYLDYLTVGYTQSLFKKTENFIVEKMSDKTIFGLHILASPKTPSQREKKKHMPTISTTQTLLAKKPSPKTSTASTESYNHLKLNEKSEDLGEEHYSEKELHKLKVMLKNSDI